MAKNTNFIYGFVDIIGDSISKLIYGVVDLNPNPIVNYYLNPSSDSIRPVSISGFINENVSGIVKPVTNVKVSFIKDYTVNDKSNKEYNGEKIVVDYCMTDSNGEYTVFVEPGIYAIRIDGGKYANKVFTGQKIDGGLINEYYLSTDALISKRYDDVIELAGETEYRLVQGFLYNEQNKPLENAELIISQGKNIEVYLKTKENGKYSFLLKNGEYDLRLRGPGQSVKIVRGFNFENGKGFMNSVKAKSNILGTNEVKNEWITIY